LSHPSAKLAPRCYGPFKVVKVISPVVYWLELPPTWKIFGTFHASLLSPYRETEEHGQNFLEPPPEVIEGEEEYEVEQVLGQRTHGHWKKKQYLIKWKGYSAAHNSWEPAENIHAPELVKRYLDQSRAHVRAIVLKEEQDSGFSACPMDAALASLPLSSSTTPTLVASTMAYNKQKRAQAQTDSPGTTS
jgi:Chromo (CHRromatin Organisation MOdifier) domain